MKPIGGEGCDRLLNGTRSVGLSSIPARRSRILRKPGERRNAPRPGTTALDRTIRRDLVFLIQNPKKMHPASNRTDGSEI